MLKKLNYFSKGELCLWGLSLFFIVISFILFDRTNYLTLVSSLLGVTSLIYSAKGNPTGPLLMIVFSVLYGVISFTFSYYGEMITYLGMTLPMSVIALIYALNDIVLIVLWVLASLKDISYISVTVCFAAFLINDLYGFINWNKMYKCQNLFKPEQ